MSEQGVPDRGFLEVVREAVRASPEPPREISTARLLAGIYRSSWGLLAAAAVVAGIGVWGYLLPGSELLGWVLLFSFAAGAVYLAALPGLEARDVARGARYALATTADVTKCTLGRGRAGWDRASLHWTVHHPTLGDFRENLVIDSPWAGQIETGVRVDVLVSPSHRKTLLALGVAKVPSEPNADVGGQLPSPRES